MEKLKDIKAWLLHQPKSLLNKKVKDKSQLGYRALFDGNRTDKLATAQLLGKDAGKAVHHVDLSTIVSKFIGETEKNLDAVFKQAEGKNWILFFDEADALFGKRTDIKDSHDRFANKEVNYLLQKMEAYPGLVILTANLKGNIDNAFIRRFHTVVHFAKP